MSIASIFKSHAEGQSASASAAIALRQHLADVRTVQQEDAEWALKESAAVADIQKHDAAHAVLQQIEDRHLAALADREVGSTSAEDPDALAEDLRLQRAHVKRLGERRRLAEKVLERVRAQRAQLRDRQRVLSTAHPDVQHAAAIEGMQALAQEFLAAERAYLQVFARTFGAALAADRCAHGRPQLGSTMGGLNLADMLLPRPVNPAFQPRPDRAQLWAHIEAEAGRILKDDLT